MLSRVGTGHKFLDDHSPHSFWPVVGWQTHLGNVERPCFRSPAAVFLILIFLILFTVNKASDLDDLISKLLVRECQWFLVVLNLWEYGLADLCHFWLELLFFSRTLFTLPENCVLMLFVLALWKDHCGISSQVQGPLNQPGKLAGWCGLLAI